MLALDLFCGTGSATQAFRDAGWEVVGVDLDPVFSPDVVADLRQWSWAGRRPDLVWASPPCDEFARESMPWSATGLEPSTMLVLAALRIIDECKPGWWVIENVKGAARYLSPLLGYPLVLGPVHLWGRFPRFSVRVDGWKEKLSSKQHVQRAKMPPQIGKGLLDAIVDEMTLLSHAGPPAC